MKNKVINIEDVYRKFRQLKVINLEEKIPFKDLAKELKVSPTDLMDFYETNTDLIDLDTKKVKGSKKALLAITRVYTDKAQNPKTEEWLEAQKEKYKDILLIEFKNDWGSLYSPHITTSEEYLRRNLTRNTEEKIERVKKVLGVTHDDIIPFSLGIKEKIEKETGLKVRVSRHFEQYLKHSSSYKDYLPLIIKEDEE